MFLLCATQELLAQFTWSNPQPSGFLNNKVAFSNASTGFIMNSNGELLRTTDGGNQWSIYRSFPGAQAVDAKDTLVMVAGSSSFVHISTNAGQSWSTSVIQPTNPTLTITDIEIISRDTAFAVGRNLSLSGVTTLYRTTNRGQT